MPRLQISKLLRGTDLPGEQIGRTATVQLLLGLTVVNQTPKRNEITL